MENSRVEHMNVCRTIPAFTDSVQLPERKEPAASFERFLFYLKLFRKSTLSGLVVSGADFLLVRTDSNLIQSIVARRSS